MSVKVVYSRATGFVDGAKFSPVLESVFNSEFCCKHVWRIVNGTETCWKCRSTCVRENGKIVEYTSSEYDSNDGL